MKWSTHLLTLHNLESGLHVDEAQAQSSCHVKVSSVSLATMYMYLSILDNITLWKRY